MTSRDKAPFSCAATSERHLVSAAQLWNLAAETLLWLLLQVLVTLAARVISASPSMALVLVRRC